MKNKSAKPLGLIFLILCASGCGKSGNGDSGVHEFLSVHPISKDGGLSLPNGDFAKYAISSDEKTATATIEVSNGGHCYRVTGSLSVDLIGGADGNNQYWQLEGLKVQINPKDDGELKYNFQFVHFVIDRSDKYKVPCSAAPKESVDQQKYQSKLSRTYFSDFPLNNQQLAMAGSILPRGSHTFMLYFKKHSLGLAFDAETNELVGIDVPKQSLETDYVFTTSRKYLQTDNTPEDAFYPLMMTDEDLKIHQRATEIVKIIHGADERLKDRSQQDRQTIIGGTWLELFTK